MHSVFVWIIDSIGTLGYPGIIVLMAIESSFFPLPSELVMIPAGYLVFQGKMDAVVVVLCGTFGSILGALFNYYMALLVGRPFLHRYGKYFLISEEKLTKVERFFEVHGPFSTFTGRLIPVVRHLISIPAGLARMALGKFIFYTAVGAWLWMIVLTALGYFIGYSEELIHQYLSLITIVTLGLLAVATVVYIYYCRKKVQNPGK